MFSVLIIYELFVAALSTFLVWHFPTSGGLSWLLGLGFFTAFNGLFFFMRLPKKNTSLSSGLTILWSFLLAVVSYLIIIFIMHDFLLIIPPYGHLYFSYPHYFTGFFILSAIIISFYAVWNTQNIKIKHYHLTTTKKVSVKVAFLSDLHISPNNMSATRLNDILSKLTDLKPDFVIMGGDIIEMRPDYFMERTLQEQMKKFTARFPVIAVVGNHEYYGGSIAENILAMQQTGILILKDAVRYIPEKNIALIGRDDKTNPHRMPLSRLMENIPDSVYKIVIDHDPSSLAETMKTTADLQLSGHTHNGQLFPFNLLVKYMFLNAYGYHKLNHLDSIVSSGVGIWGPHLRIGTHNEIVVIDISDH